MADEPKTMILNNDVAIEALKKAGAMKPCPRCGNDTFKILSGFFNPSIQQGTSGVVLGGPSLPCWVLVCARCGFVSMHSVEALTGVTQIEPITH